MAECETCDKWFVNTGAAAQHMDALGHWAVRYECETCDFDSIDEDVCNEHMDLFEHWHPRVPCEGCPKLFYTQGQARSHMDSMKHWRNHWCKDCKRGFQNANNLRQHMHSSAHRKNALPCPFCFAPFTAASGVAHHLERNTCPQAKQLDRETIYKIVRQMDTTGMIVNKQIAWHSDENCTYNASDAAWNGHYYECYLCHREFNQLCSLNQHLESSVHKQRIYHCISRRCGQEFSTLAALFNHLESESCGATRFETVQRNAARMFTSNRMIAF